MTTNERAALVDSLHAALETAYGARWNVDSMGVVMLIMPIIERHLAAGTEPGPGLDELLKEIGAVTLSSTSSGVMATVRTAEDNYYQAFGSNSYDAIKAAVAAARSPERGAGEGVDGEVHDD